jgi:drug/metabolite transporter (DMT)-like permease
MNNWLLISTVGYLLLAIEAIITKILLSNKVKSWQLYSFYVGLLSLNGVLFAPFGLKWFGGMLFLESLLTGTIFFLALVFLYKSLEKSSASRVFILYGSVVTVASFFWEYLLLGQLFSKADLMAVLLLILGGFLVSFKFYKNRMFSDYKTVIFSGFLMALALVMMKDIFTQQNFITGYVFSRFGVFLSALSLMLYPKFRRVVKASLKNKSKKDNQKNFGFILGAKIVSGTGTILINYAISLGSVTIINALVSVQYSFVFIFIVLLGFLNRKMIQEKVTTKNIIFKTAGLILVIMGIFLIHYF